MKTILHHFRYRWFPQAFTDVFNILGFSIPFVIIFSYWYDLLTMGRSTSKFNIPDLILITLIIWLFSGSICIFTGNYYTEVLSDADGLHARYLWGKLDVPWASIVSLKPMFSIPRQRTTFVVKCRLKSVGVVHRLYGFYYTCRFSPCIIIHKDLLMESDELIRRIRAAIQQNQDVINSRN